tara:strand:+ start:140 stop:1567 length:1428 start_codon:yes stop_codon:yes gene_type:complete
MLNNEFMLSKKEKPFLLINIIFAFFPLSFIFGSAAVNLNIILFCLFGAYHLKSKILTIEFDFLMKIIFLFFFIVFFSTSLNFTKTLYLTGYDSNDFERLLKSIIYFRFFLFLIIVKFTNKYEILSFKYFFITAGSLVLLFSLDVIFQHFVGHNIIGIESGIDFRSSGFFGSEHVAGSFIQRFSFFGIFLIAFILKNKNLYKFIFMIVAICVFGCAMLVSGNRMSLILFILGLLLLVPLNLKINKILLLSFVGLFFSLKFIINFDDLYKAHINTQYKSFYGNIENTVTMSNSGETITWKLNNQRAPEDEALGQQIFFYKIKRQSMYRRLILTSVDLWSLNKTFGNGIKSFRVDCHKLASPTVNISEEQYPGVKNRLCSQHPHNYYFEILTDTGAVGLIISLIIALIFVIFIYKNVKILKNKNIEGLVLLSAVISLFLELFPLRNTGSIFTSNNASYIILIASIVICYKKILKIKTE